MNHIEFMPYHNRHIKFSLFNGIEFQGVVIDPMNHHKNNNIPDTFYKFIPTFNMIAWKQAEQKGDADAMEKLQEEIDILDIETAIHVNY